jgi:hypothetical protein
MRLPQRTLPLAVTPRHLSSASGTAPPEAVDLRSRPMSRATRLGRLGSKSYKRNITCECGKRAKPYLHHARREELCRISHSTAQTETWTRVMKRNRRQLRRDQSCRFSSCALSADFFGGIGVTKIKCGLWIHFLGPSTVIETEDLGQIRLSRPTPGTVPADSDVPRLADQVHSALQIVGLCQQRMWRRQSIALMLV